MPLQLDDEIDYEKILNNKELQIKALNQQILQLKILLEIEQIRNKISYELIKKTQPAVKGYVKFTAIENIAYRIQTLANSFNLICDLYEIQIEETGETNNIIKKPLVPIISTEFVETNDEPMKKSTYKNLSKMLLPEFIYHEHDAKIMDKFETKKHNTITFENAFSLFQENLKDFSGRKIKPKQKEMLEKRKKLLPNMEFSEFLKLLTTFYNKIEALLETESDLKKKNSLLFGYLTPLESRLLMSLNYTNTTIDYISLDDLKMSLWVSNLYFENRFSPFNIKPVCDSFRNYSIALINLERSLIDNLYNPYGFQNIVYIPLKQSREDDPYSFYTLQKIEKNKRFWDMDCRLEEIASIMIDELLPYAIALFRKIYYDTFHDNNFRENFTNVNAIMKEDCSILLKNIMLLSNRYRFYAKIRKIIMDKFSYKLDSDYDRFNIYADDTLQRNKFKNETEKKTDMEEIEYIKGLFDEIPTKHCVDLIREYEK